MIIDRRSPSLKVLFHRHGETITEISPAYFYQNLPLMAIVRLRELALGLCIVKIQCCSVPLALNARLK